MRVAQSDRVREIVKSEYVENARRGGLQRFAVSARDVLHKAEADPAFPRARTPLICTVLQSKKLLDENGLEIERIEGPPSLQSRRVVVHYAFREVAAAGADRRTELDVESATDRAFRLTERLRGLMREEIAAYGGGEAYLRWVRGEEDAA